MNQKNKLLMRCHNDMIEINNIIRDRIVNAYLAVPLQTDSILTPEQQYQALCKELIVQQAMSNSIQAQYWPVSATFLFMVLFHHKDVVGNFTSIMGATLFVGVFLLLLEKKLGCSPASDIFITFLGEDATKNASRLNNAYKHVKTKADNSIQGIMPLLYSHTRSTFFKQTIPYHMQHAINQGLFSLDQNVYDCVAASALLILKLLSSEIYKDYKIERFYRIGNTTRPHSYVVVNRKEGDVNDIFSWNDDALVACAWYSKCFFAEEAKSNPGLLKEYLLLDPKGCSSCEVNPKNKLEPGYVYAITEFNKRFDKVSREKDKLSADFLGATEDRYTLQA